MSAKKTEESKSKEKVEILSKQQRAEVIKCMEECIEELSHLLHKIKIENSQIAFLIAILDELDKLPSNTTLRVSIISEFKKSFITIVTSSERVFEHVQCTLKEISVIISKMIKISMQDNKTEALENILQTSPKDICLRKLSEEIVEIFSTGTKNNDTRSNDTKTNDTKTKDTETEEKLEKFFCTSLVTMLESKMKEINEEIKNIELTKQACVKWQEKETIEKCSKGGCSDNPELRRRNAVQALVNAVSDIDPRLELKCSEVGYLFCADCNEFYPGDETKHSGHHYYETLQASLRKGKDDLLKEAELRIQELNKYKPKNDTDLEFQKIQEDLGKYLDYQYSNQQIFRIASWNLKHLGDESKNFKKRLQCVCKTILYYEIDVIALQEVGVDCTELETLMLNTLRYYSRLKWTIVKERVKGEHLFIVFNEKSIINESRLEISRKDIPKIMCSSMQYRDNFSLTIINTHIAHKKGDREDNLNSLTEAVKPWDDKYSILLGDFNVDPDELRTKIGEVYQCIFKQDEYTNTLRTKSFDNIAIREDQSQVKEHHHFVGSIITDGELTEGEVSDHLPIIAELEFLTLPNSV